MESPLEDAKSGATARRMEKFTAALPDGTSAAREAALDPRTLWVGVYCKQNNVLEPSCLLNTKDAKGNLVTFLQLRKHRANLGQACGLMLDLVRFLSLPTHTRR